MDRTLSNPWWLLFFCGVLDAASAVLNLMMLNLDGSPSLRRFASVDAVQQMSLLALAAGICAIAAGFWNYGKRHSWLLSLHGLALAAFGLIGLSPLVRGPLSFRPISLLFVVMSLSLGAFAWMMATALWRAAAVCSIIFATSFVAVGFGVVTLGSPHFFWIWMASYFALCSIYMLSLATRFRRAVSFPNGVAVSMA